MDAFADPKEKLKPLKVGYFSRPKRVHKSISLSSPQLVLGSAEEQFVEYTLEARVD